MVSGPIIVINPGQEITQTAVPGGPPLVVWAQGNTPRSPGAYRLRYSYSWPVHADFRVVAFKRVLAVTVLQLRERDIRKEANGNIVRGRPSVPFVAAEMANDKVWLFRADPRCCRASYFNAPPESYGLRIFEFLYGFERAGVLEEPVTKLNAELLGDDTVDVTAETASQRQVRLNVPSAPAKIEPHR